jgi:hypothetical protein
MALNHPVHPHTDGGRPEGGPQPAISLLAGFGLIVLVATIVHVVFNVLV